jgi:F-type H+-transporting ATPase subunit b
MEILQNFGIQTNLLVAQIVNFLIIFFVLKKFFYKPIVKTLEDRKKTIAESLKNAETIEKTLAETEKKAEAVYAATHKESAEILTAAKNEAEKLLEQARNSSKEMLEETLKKAREEISFEKAEMKKELEGSILKLATKVAEKVLSRNLNDKERESLTKKAFSEIESTYES